MLVAKGHFMWRLQQIQNFAEKFVDIDLQILAEFTSPASLTDPKVPYGRLIRKFP